MAAASCFCCRLAVAPRLAAAAAVVVASSASGAAAGKPVRRIRRRAPGPPPAQPLKPAPATQPSVAEVRRAIGLGDDDPSASSRRERQSAFMELIASTPIGQPEGAAERRLREAAEWVVDTTEERACEAQKSLLLLCMKIFPLWLLLLSIALGVLKLPFDIPALDNLLILAVPMVLGASIFQATLAILQQFLSDRKQFSSLTFAVFTICVTQSHIFE